MLLLRQDQRLVSKRPMWAALTRGMGFGQVSTKK